MEKPYTPPPDIEDPGSLAPTKKQPAPKFNIKLENGNFNFPPPRVKK
jgi:hypothetical protein